MDAFDLGRLTDVDFEFLCQDLLSEVYGIRLELFASGPDEGVDLRHLAPATGNLVVQCKHWSRATAASLRRHLELSELPKVVKLSPDRYILATSVDLSKKAKDSLFALLSPYVTAIGDIWGQRDIVAELARREHIVRRHMRLWLNSTAVLGGLLNRSTLMRSRDLVDDTHSALRTYVPNASYTRAGALLEETHVCIISGIPGIGKTTLAQVLAAAYAAEGYEVLEVSSDVDEVNDIWRDEAAQFLYYDDFLGQSTLEEKLNKNEDARLLRLLKRIHDSPNKRFVLTTREYILAQAQTQYEKLDRTDFRPLRCVLDLADYTRLVRGEMLYNHIYFSDIAPESKREFASPDVYLPIVSHRNFSPRLVEMSLTGFQISDAHQSAAQYIRSNLENPRQIWAHIVENQLSEPELRVVELLATMPRLSSLDDLRASWVRYGEIQKVAADSRTFARSVHKLDGTMLRSSQSVGRTISIDFHNPSIRDYIGQHLGQQADRLKQIVQSAPGISQLQRLLAAGTSERTGELGLALKKMRDLISSVALEHVDELLAHGGYPSAAQALQLLSIAEELQSHDLWSCTADVLGQEKLYSEATDGDDLVALLDRMNRSDRLEIRQLVERATQLSIDWIVGDLSDWGNARYAQSLLEEMRDLAPADVVLRVDDAVDELARSIIEYWAEGSIRYEADIAEVLEYADNQYDPESAYPGFGAVRDEVHGRREERRAPAPQEQDGEKGIDDLELLERMFSTLDSTDHPESG